VANPKKQGRVAERIKQVLSELLQFEVSDPRLAGATVLDVEVDGELMYATVYVTSLGGQEARAEVLDGLDNATGYLRRELAARLTVRRVPELRWRWDETITYASRIEDLLDSLDIPPVDDDDS
jgi:ribosome-binding factor A